MKLKTTATQSRLKQRRTLLLTYQVQLLVLGEGQFKGSKSCDLHIKEEANLIAKKNLVSLCWRYTTVHHFAVEARKVYRSRPRPSLTLNIHLLLLQISRRRTILGKLTPYRFWEVSLHIRNRKHETFLKRFGKPVWLLCAACLLFYNQF